MLTVVAVKKHDGSISSIFVPSTNLDKMIDLLFLAVKVFFNSDSERTMAI
jgi:hypothetical protein